MLYLKLFGERNMCAASCFLSEERISTAIRWSMEFIVALWGLFRRTKNFSAGSSDALAVSGYTSMFLASSWAESSGSLICRVSKKGS